MLAKGPDEPSMTFEQAWKAFGFEEEPTWLRPADRVILIELAQKYKAEGTLEQYADRIRWEIETFA